MSASPEETENVEQAAPSPDENEQQQQEGETSRTDDPGDQVLGYDFEVKEQDRWLPIANGKSAAPCMSPRQLSMARLPACVTVSP